MLTHCVHSDTIKTDKKYKINQMEDIKMKSIMSKVVEIAQKKWNKIKNEDGFTKEDAIVYALEVIDENGQYYDPTREEYEEAISSIV